MKIPNVQAVFVTVDPRVPLEHAYTRIGAAMDAMIPEDEGGTDRPDRFVLTFVHDDGRTSAVRLHGIRLCELEHALARAVGRSRNNPRRG